jgi:hypothetical protein
MAGADASNLRGAGELDELVWAGPPRRSTRERTATAQPAAVVVEQPVRKTKQGQKRKRNSSTMQIEVGPAIPSPFGARALDREEPRAHKFTNLFVPL